MDSHWVMSWDISCRPPLTKILLEVSAEVTSMWKRIVKMTLIVDGVVQILSVSVGLSQVVVV